MVIIHKTNFLGTDDDAPVLQLSTLTIFLSQLSERRQEVVFLRGWSIYPVLFFVAMTSLLFRGKDLHQSPIKEWGLKQSQVSLSYTFKEKYFTSTTVANRYVMYFLCTSYSNMLLNLTLQTIISAETKESVHIN